MVMQGFVAMPIGAALFALSEPLPFALSALTFAGSAVLAVTLPAAAARARRADPHAATETADAAAPAAPVPFRAQLADGARYLWRHDRLRPLWIVSTLTAGTMAFAQGALIVYVVDGLGIGQAAVGAFTALAGVGGVLGAVLVGPLRARVGRPASMLVALVATGPLLVLFGAVPNGPVGRVIGCGAFALVAMFVMIWNTNAMTVRQRLIPAELLGRVNGTWRTVGWGLTPVATLLGGVVARSGLRLPFLIGGAVVLGIALVGLPAVRRATTLPDADADERLAPAPVGTLDA
jgi:Na+/melibiose symporter-like transporter